MLETIYAPTNEVFEVTAEKAADLVLNHGWTRSPVFASGGVVDGPIAPIVYNDPKPAARRRPRKTDLAATRIED